MGRFDLALKRAEPKNHHGGKPPVEELKMLEYDSHWIVVHGNKFLCESISHWDYTKRYPIKWKKAEDCNKWIESGTIGELQENYQNLHIGFTRHLVKEREHGN